MAKKMNALKSGFWKCFRENHWEREPLAVSETSGIGTLHISQEQIFETILKLAEYMRSKKAQVRGRAYVNDTEIASGEELSAFLPTREDESFEKYHERLISGDKSIRYGIILNSVQAYDHQLWELLCRQLQPFIKEIGISRSDCDIVLFLGNYERSAAGVHTDAASLFHFPIVGTKKIRTWKSDYAKAHPELMGSHDYEGHNKKSTLLETGPGGMIYWPSDRWHIGESDGQFSLSLALPYFLDYRADYSILEKIHAKTLQDATVDSVKKMSIPFSRSNFETNADKYISESKKDFIAYQQSIAKLIESEQACKIFQEETLKRLSAYGFTRVPSIIEQRELTFDDLVRVDSIFPFLFARLTKKKYIVACRGHSMEVEAAANIHLFIQLLNTGQAFTVRELTTRFFSKQQGTYEVPDLLQKLQKLGGLEILTPKEKKMIA